MRKKSKFSIMNSYSVVGKEEEEKNCRPRSSVIFYVDVRF